MPDTSSRASRAVEVLPDTSPAGRTQAKHPLLKRRTVQRTLAGAVLLGALCGVAPARAHQVSVFATVQGKLIVGEVYFQGGDAARGIRVTILDSRGQKLADTVTDQDGKFTYEPRFRDDHKLVANAGLGHKAQYTVAASELPADLPADLPETDPGASAARADRRTASGITSPRDDLAPHIESLTQQIIALRVELDKWKARLRLQDILGGIGYIVGLMGLISYLRGMRRKGERAGTGH